MFDKFFCRQFHEKSITLGMIKNRYFFNNPLFNELMCIIWIFDIAFIICFTAIYGIVASTLGMIIVLLITVIFAVLSALTENKVVAVCPLSKKPEQ